MRRRIALLVGITLGCGAESSQPAPSASSGALPAGVVARAGSAEIHAETVARIVESAEVSPEIARERAISDALFAQEAEQRLPRGMAVTLERAVLGRALLEQLRREAERQGDPTDEEVERATRERWLDLDRPESARVTHAVVLPGNGDPARARQVAEEMARAVQGLQDPTAFMEAAKRVPAEGFTVRAERLPPMTPDGRGFVLDGLNARATQSFDPTFARAANALAEPGEQSGIVETPFGFHVILLEAKLPEVRIPLEDRRRVVTEEVVGRRANEARRALLTASKQRTTVEIARDFDARTGGLGGS